MTCFRRSLLVGLVSLVIVLPSFGQVTLDLNRMVSNGQCLVTSTALDIGPISNLFDLQESTLIRTPSINPLVVTVQCSQSVSVSRTELVPAAGVSVWTLESASSLKELNGATGTYRKLVNQRRSNPEVLDGGSFTPVTAMAFRLTVLRTTGDNYVHLREWRLITAAAPQTVMVTSALQTIYPTWTFIPSVQVQFGFGSGLAAQSAVSWTSLTPALATVDASGKVTARAPGQARVQATVNGISASLFFSVTAPARAPEIDLNPTGLNMPAKKSLYEIPVVIFR